MSEANTIELLCQLTHAATLQELCDLACKITGNPVFISDLAHTILAYTQCVEVDDPTWQTRIVGAQLERNTLRQEREVGSVHLNSTGAQRPELVNDGDLPYPRLVKTLISEGQAVGVMVLTAYLQPLGANDAELLELISSFAMPCLMRERYHLSADSQATENYFIKLLDGAAFSRDRVNKRLEVLGYVQKDYTYILVICAREGEDGDATRGLDDMLGALAGLRSCRVFFYNCALVCVYGSDTPITDWEHQEEHLKELMDSLNLVAGVSRQIEGMEQMKTYYDQAQSVLEVGRQLGRRGTYFPYDSLSSFLLFGRISTEQLHLYCHQQIRELGQYDKLHNTDLCVTLQVYLEQTKSLVHTAEILFVHRNTVRYRINKCMELLGSNLEDGNEIFAFILSLRILEYEAKVLRKQERPSII